ncbi:hypothetical protein [Leifsonia sp. fls2-241-R2A-40a]|uniref:hypothetical protein n=1 Tax=Leifsonia sp. fls2-241-R2A-40a TaxID=3040290 RepID=UPI00254A75CF|nr:hypothetical protein [Leifsonia sp. fls2-241-R2A-40a]
MRDAARVDATALLQLISDSPSGGTAIVLRTPEAPPFVVMGDDTEEGFSRLRRGAIAYGVPELYQALPRDMLRTGHILHVRDDHRPARVDKAGSIFGPAPEKLWVPLGDDGRPFASMRIPIPSLERPAYVEFALDRDGDVLEYRLVGEARLGDGYICPYCGKLCPQKEPHTAAHGVAGHTHAGVAAGQDQDGPAPETGPLEVRGHPGTGTRL